jgi:hypothetical protein
MTRLAKLDFHTYHGSVRVTMLGKAAFISGLSNYCSDGITPRIDRDVAVHQIVL